MITAHKHSRKVRFLIVGSINTCIDFSILLLLFSVFGIQKEMANIISTTIGFCFSFLANRSFTFTSKGGYFMRQLLLFTVVTIFGLWILQGLIIWLMTPPLLKIIKDNHLTLVVAKIIATIITLLWNYVLYSRVVFKSSTTEQPTNSAD